MGHRGSGSPVSCVAGRERPRLGRVGRPVRASPRGQSVTLRVGIIGCGRIVEDAHAPSLLSLADTATIVALADPSTERREAVAAIVGSVPAEHEDWREMLEEVAPGGGGVAGPPPPPTTAIVDGARAGGAIVTGKAPSPTPRGAERIQ